MRIVVQRVLEAAVRVNGDEISKIGKGMLILLGITHGDNPEVVSRYASKMLKLRIWDEIPKNKVNEDKDDETSSTSTQSNEEEKLDTRDSKAGGKGLKSWDSNVVDNNFEILVVSQFTLYGILKGNKPDFH